MKNFFIAVLYLFSGQILAQTGESFYAQLPDLPSGICIVDTASRGYFNRQLSRVSNQLKEVILKKKKEVQKEADNLKPEMEKKLAQEYGLSEADVQRLKDKKLSKEEKKKIADKMMQEKANISMEEIEQLKKMSKEGKQAWAEAYGTEIMANMPSGDSVKTEEQIKMEKEIEKNSRLNELVKEQKLILDKIHAVNKRYDNRLIELRKEDSIQTVILEAQCEPLRKQLANSSGEDQKSIYQQIASFHIFYCQKLTPMNVEMIAEAKNSVGPLLPDYDRLEEINTEINKIMFGAKDGLNSPGLLQLGAVEGLANIMSGAYKYAIPIELAVKLIE